MSQTLIDFKRYETDPAYRQAVDGGWVRQAREQTTPGPTGGAPIPGVPVASTPNHAANNPNVPVQAANTPNVPAQSVTADFDTSPGSGLLYQLRPYLDALGDENVDAKGGFRAGRELGREFFDFNSLGRVGSMTPDMDLDPNKTGLLDPTKYLERVRGLSETAGTRSPELQELLRRRFANLDGLTQEENQAFKDKGEQVLNQNLRTGMRALRSRTPGLVGPASMIGANPVIQQFRQGSTDLARDLTLANIEAKDKALSGAESLVRGAETDEFNRKKEAQAAEGQSVFTTRQDLLGRNVFDLQQLAKEKAGQLGLLFGSGQFGAAQEARREANEIAREGIDKAANTSIPSLELPDFGSIFGSIFDMFGNLFAEDEEDAPLLPGPPKGDTLPKGS